LFVTKAAFEQHLKDDEAKDIKGWSDCEASVDRAREITGDNFGLNFFLSFKILNL